MTPKQRDTMAETIVVAIKGGLKMFGEYDYYDKGADEVMDVRPLELALRTLSPQDAAAVLDKVMDFEHGEPFCHHVVVNWDEEPNFDEFLDACSPRLRAHY